MSKTKTDVKSSVMSMRVPSQYIKTSPMDPYRNTLPEQEIVDFVIKTNITENIETYYSVYGFIPQRILYKGNYQLFGDT